ncbi:lysoplasmalogenase TMEM86A-like [Saccoglossus kowalevskii]|uniref:lysoplasmalogenase n=1 Tax=Saccoglossus kowalevskii TaxID=10224 RepID=A0ABM0GJN4_SACKO|nr:PREDICTED: lysoplasmalogenase-like protein TMEM86A-like [Saccoglossus kowalevskii]
MTSPITVIKSVGPKLVPFFKTTCIYFVLWLPEPSVLAAVVKILPILSLGGFILIHRVSFPSLHRFSYGILAGLFFSCFGDIFLVFKENYFIHGLCAFAIAQLIYAINFGFKPFKWSVLLVLSLLSFAVYVILYPSLFGPLVYLAAVYITLLGYMTWRAIARLQFFERRWTWSKMSGCFGAVLFSISDLLIGLNKFVFPVPYVRVIVMLTYYTAQLGIVLSVVDYHKCDDLKNCVDVDTKSDDVSKKCSLNFHSADSPLKKNGIKVD